MKEKIQELIEIIKSKKYDEEATHGQYDELLEEFILNYDESLLGLMKECISLEKHFWYA